MTTFINKTVMVVLLCLIFLGQSMASMSMFYNMVSMQAMTKAPSTSNTHHMMAANDSAHDMAAMTTDDCCAQECDCLTSSCSTVSAFSAIITYTPIFATTTKIALTKVLTVSQTPSSLYRPPILS